VWSKKIGGQLPPIDGFIKRGGERRLSCSPRKKMATKEISKGINTIGPAVNEKERRG